MPPEGGVELNELTLTDGGFYTPISSVMVFSRLASAIWILLNCRLAVTMWSKRQAKLHRNSANSCPRLEVFHEKAGIHSPNDRDLFTWIRMLA
jgi:hypothetical protein